MEQFPAGDETGVPHLSFTAPLAYHAAALRCDMQTGILDRAPEGMHDGFTRNFLFGLPESGDRGLSLLSDCRYGCRLWDNTLHLSLLRASNGPDRYPEIGERFCRIGLAPSDSSAFALKELGERFAHWSFPYTTNTAHPGSLPLTGQLVSVEGGVSVSGIKMSEEGNSFILRLANLSDSQPAEAVLHFGIPVSQAAETDLAEIEKQSLSLSGNTLTLSLAPGQVMTIKAE